MMKILVGKNMIEIIIFSSPKSLKMSPSTFSEFKTHVRVSTPATLSELLAEHQLELVLTQKKGKIKAQSNYTLQVRVPGATKVSSLYVALPTETHFTEVIGKFNYRQAVWTVSDEEDASISDWVAGFDGFLEQLLETIRPEIDADYELKASPIFQRKTKAISFSAGPKPGCDLERLNSARGAYVYGGIDGIYLFKNEESKRIYVGFNWKLYETPVPIVAAKVTGKRKAEVAAAVAVGGEDEEAD
jgi:hypothetical protein